MRGAFPTPRPNAVVTQPVTQRASPGMLGAAAGLLAIPAPGHSAKDPPRTPQPSLVRIQALLALAPLLSGSAGHPPNQASSNGADVKFGVAHRLWWIKAKILTSPGAARATWS